MEGYLHEEHKHDQVHGLLGHAVEVTQVLLHHTDQSTAVLHLPVQLYLGLRVHEVTCNTHTHNIAHIHIHIHVMWATSTCLWK